MKIARRHLVSGAAAAWALAGAAGGWPRFVTDALAEGSDHLTRLPELYGETAPFSPQRLRELAQALAQQDYDDRRGDIPASLSDMDYATYRQIQPWKKWPQPLGPDKRFSFDALPPGFVYNQPVEIWVVEGETAQKVVYDPESYWVGELAEGKLPKENVPFSGFRLHANVADSESLSEFAVFQGASYFRAVGRHETYGLSARGLAIDTGVPTGEEFPVFRAFWLETTADDANGVVVHALLDSPSTTGVYRFTIAPGDATFVDVELTLFPRRSIKTIGFAPFSSMFLFSGVNRWDFVDYRDAVHDSDGLSIFTGGGEWLWRPINNPDRLQISAFVDENPRGFGLVQRSREFSDYEDAEARYELRTSAWVEPRGDWGKGSVVLFEIPTTKEWNDNIVAYWQPATELPAGQPFDLAYRIHWEDVPQVASPGPQVIKTRIGRNLSDDRYLFVVDYLMRGTSTQNLEMRISASTGTVSNLVTYPVPERDVQRVTFELDPKDSDLVEIRLALEPEDGPPGERWLYRWTR
ncbi:glucan biosynthesis protein [Acuticoccus sp. I52.16.1]|uniref:glucan biosynthesis protein n=1 Tax=Acuticoccus sp. I52.16.1 TaxID=2928472 RepID=UPI001FCF8527|nr:glucan biosynthesis protein [Acuticoccus sp. I52.16.1]UOM33212.1 glucan biosynthesis protein [Acuticoccus sp. I52.16.1]